MQRPGGQPPAVSEKPSFSKWRFQSVLTIRSKPNGGLEWNGCFLLVPLCTLNRQDFGNSTHVLS
jgi:hypothetical protein